MGGHKKAADSASCALSFVGRPRSVWVANLAAIAQHQRILVEIRHSEVIQVTRGALALTTASGLTALLRATTTLTFVISTEAKRSGEICGLPSFDRCCGPQTGLVLCLGHHVPLLTACYRSSMASSTTCMSVFREAPSLDWSARP